MVTTPGVGVAVHVCQQLCDLANDTARWAKHINDTFPTKKNNDTEPPN